MSATRHHFVNFAAILIGTIAMCAGVQAQCAEQWVSDAGIPGADFGINALAIHPSGEVIVGGSFQNAGGMPAARIAKYSPATGVWSNLGTSGGMNEGVGSLLILPNGDILAGGRFTTAGGVPANRIARYSWSSGTWSALGGPGVGGGVLGVGGGPTPTVMSMCLLPGGQEVMIGGVFLTSGGTGGIATNYISRFNLTTNTWSTVGPTVGVSGAVRAIVQFDPDTIIIGGEFGFAGSVSAGRIAKYTISTNSWSSIGSMSTWVHALAMMPDGDLIAGGQFITAAGVPANRVARYHPTSSTTGIWSAIGTTGGSGSGINNGLVYSLSVRPGGNLIVGGSIGHAGGVAANNIAQYDWTAGTWSALGVGVNLTVDAQLFLPGGDLLIGGGFTTAGGQNANRLARYSFGSSCPSDFNCDNAGDFFDYLDFVDAFAVNAMSADFNEDGIVDFFDYLDFVDAFSEGC